MIGLDTNILIRMLVQDDPVQVARVEQLVDSLSMAWPSYISHVTLTELVWVLTSRYRYSRVQIADSLELLLRAIGLKIEQADVIWNVLQAYRESNADFADLLIERDCAAAGCEYTLTFDVDSSKRTGMRLLLR